MKDMTARWRVDLNAEQQAQLTDVLREDLQRYGYDVSPPLGRRPAPDDGVPASRLG
jgi:hypothetical protein